jgi:hypothetical protein
MEKKGWRTGRGQRRADLLTDDARLAEAHCDHAAGRGVDQFDDVDEGAVEMIDEPKDGRRFDLQHAPRLGDRGMDFRVTDRGGLPRFRHRR